MMKWTFLVVLLLMVAQISYQQNEIDDGLLEDPDNLVGADDLGEDDLVGLEGAEAGIEEDADGGEEAILMEEQGHDTNTEDDASDEADGEVQEEVDEDDNEDGDDILSEESSEDRRGKMEDLDEVKDDDGGSDDENDESEESVEDESREDGGAVNQIFPHPPYLPPQCCPCGVAGNRPPHAPLPPLRAPRPGFGLGYGGGHPGEFPGFGAGYGPGDRGYGLGDGANEDNSREDSEEEEGGNGRGNADSGEDSDESNEEANRGYEGADKGYFGPGNGRYGPGYDLGQFSGFGPGNGGRFYPHGDGYPGGGYQFPGERRPSGFGGGFSRGGFGRFRG